MADPYRVAHSAEQWAELRPLVGAGTAPARMLTRRWGRALRGVWLRERVPRNHGDNLTRLSAIGMDDVVASLVFPRALDGPLLTQ